MLVIFQIEVDEDEKYKYMSPLFSSLLNHSFFDKLILLYPSFKAKLGPLQLLSYWKINEDVPLEEDTYT